MIKPEYDGGSIVNLMASLVRHYGGQESIYPGLDLLPEAELQQARHIVLLVVDGLGYEFLQQQGGFLQQHCRGRLTSVFPSTTASANTVFLSGQAPQQHGLTGWHMYMRELAAVVTTLPFVTRFGGLSLRESGYSAGELFDSSPVYARMNVPVKSLLPSYIAFSDFSMAYAAHANISGYDSLEQGLVDLRDSILGAKQSGYHHFYWPGLDAMSHEKGFAHEQTLALYREIDDRLAHLREELKGSDTLVLVTADHGMMDTSRQHTVDLPGLDSLYGLLRLPLCGERRCSYCYVKSSKQREFERELSAQLADSVDMFASADLLAQGWFGLDRPHPELHNRIGDYILLAKDDWTLMDYLPGKEPFYLVGVHGGASSAEMYVPLVAFAC